MLLIVDFLAVLKSFSEIHNSLLFVKIEFPSLSFDSTNGFDAHKSS